MNTLGLALSAEYEEKGITIQTVVPNQVKTKASKELHKELVSVSSEDLVEHILASVGKERFTSGHPKHKLINGLTTLASYLLDDNILIKIKLLFSKALRNEYDRKIQKLEK